MAEVNGGKDKGVDERSTVVVDQEFGRRPTKDEGQEFGERPKSRMTEGK